MGQGKQTGLWYVRRDGREKGPFPAAVVQQHLVLGRITEDDLLSVDRRHWESAAAVPEFRSVLAADAPERLFAQADERRAERRSSAAPGSDGDRPARGADRRRGESADRVQRRALSNDTWRSLETPPGVRKTAWLPVAAALLILGTGLGLRLPKQSILDNCDAAPAPGVDWETCDKQASQLRQADLGGASLRGARFAASDLAGANLARADLAYADFRATNLELANLTASRLIGADLREATMRHVSLRNADLRFVDLRGADIDGADLRDALLGNAIWTTGVTCGDDSVGSCRLP